MASSRNIRKQGGERLPSIAFVTCHFPPDSIGGGQIQSQRLCAVLAREQKVTVYVRDYTGSAPPTEQVDGYLIERRVVSSIPGVRSLVDLITGVAWIRSQHRTVEVFVAFHVQLAALMVVLGKRFFGLTAVVSPRGQEDFDFRGFFRGMVQAFVYRSADALLLQSPTIRSLLETQLQRRFGAKRSRAIMDRVHVVPNIIQPAGTGSLRSRTPRQGIVYVGRLVDYKGVGVLLEALRKMDIAPTTRLIGDGPDRQRLTALAEDLPVEFLGERPPHEIRNVLATAKVFVLPSLTENLPNAVLEALEAGVPVVATRVGALPEIIVDGVNGYLVDPGDPDGLSTAIQKVLNNKKGWPVMAAAARKSAEAYFPQTLLPVIQKVFMRIARHD